MGWCALAILRNGLLRMRNQIGYNLLNMHNKISEIMLHMHNRFRTAIHDSHLSLTGGASESKYLLNKMQP